MTREYTDYIRACHIVIAVVEGCVITFVDVQIGIIGISVETSITCVIHSSLITDTIGIGVKSVTINVTYVQVITGNIVINSAGCIACIFETAIVIGAGYIFVTFA